MVNKPFLYFPCFCSRRDAGIPCTDILLQGTPQQLGYVAYFGRMVRTSTHQVITNTKKGDGIFLPSCFAHTEGINVMGSTSINGYKPTEMIGDWFFGRPGRSPFQIVDDCREEVPCNPSCGSLIPEPSPAPETQCETVLNTLCPRTPTCFGCAMLNLPQLFEVSKAQLSLSVLLSVIFAPLFTLLTVHPHRTCTHTRTICTHMSCASRWYSDLTVPPWLRLLASRQSVMWQS
jgi:hypothetical protein